MGVCNAMANGSSKSNILMTRSEAVINYRIILGETVKLFCESGVFCTMSSYSNDNGPLRFPPTLLGLAATALLVSSCFVSPPTEAPLPHFDFVQESSTTRPLVIMLPGRGDRAETFVNQGFQLPGEKHGFDVIAVDAHFGYYRERSLVARLHEDIVLPAREAGYEHIWLLGVSLGGFGSVLYTANYPDEIDGVILLAPFLGDQSVIDEISGNGGLVGWDPAQSSLKAHEITIWSWLQAATEEGASTKLILGYGDSDRLAGSYGPLLERLDPARVYTVQGGHGWRSWGALWEEISAGVVLRQAPSMH